MIITHNREKLINVIVFFAKKTKYCGKTKIMKLLYFLDFMHFKETGKSVTELEYYAWPKGPVPKDFFEELSGELKPDMTKAIDIRPINEFQKIVPKKKFNSNLFTKRELDILDRCVLFFKNAKSDEMVEITHLKNKPWDKTIKEKGPQSKIEYMLAVDGCDNSISLEEAKERVKEREEVYKLFGAT